MSILETVSKTPMGGAQFFEEDGAHVIALLSFEEVMSKKNVLVAKVKVLESDSIKPGTIKTFWYDLGGEYGASAVKDLKRFVSALVDTRDEEALNQAIADLLTKDQPGTGLAVGLVTKREQSVMPGGSKTPVFDATGKPVMRKRPTFTFKHIAETDEVIAARRKTL